MKIRIYKIYLVTALAALLWASCAEGPAAPAVEKRTSYFPVKDSWEAPGRGLVDLTFAKGVIWLADDDGPGLIYKIDPATGSVLSSVGTVYGPPAALCTDGTYLYVAAADTGDVWKHQLGPRLEELASFPTGLTDIRGLFYDAGKFYVWDQATRTVFEYNDKWERLGSWRVGPGEEYIRGMTRIEGRVWSADYAYGWLNRHRLVNFDIDRKFCTPGYHPAGLAWDGTYLYLGDAAARRVYKIDISTPQ